MKAIENIATVYNKFYDLLYNDIIEEETISLSKALECAKKEKTEFQQLCEELNDVPVSDRELKAFYLTIIFLFV